MTYDKLILKCRAELAAVLGNRAPLAADAPFGTNALPKGFSGNLLAYLDLTNLKPQATKADITALCAKAKADGVAAVCVNPMWVSLAAELLAGTAVKPICVVGFPLGATLPEAVAAETEAALKHGALEVDMVLPVGLVKEGRFTEALTYIQAVVKAADGVPVKVILEACKLTDEEVVFGCLLSQIAGAAFVKTSTGFSMDKLDGQPHTGATVERITLMRRTVGDTLGVKASGGIKTADDAKALLAAGADRLGASGLNTSGAY
ncbi:MAG: deoxyribose-phosphate aldolase [Proteobacteria bacterium]|nr:deoxyribose-phosphate aldolase [Pseudomonadota bacterium]